MVIESKEELLQEQTKLVEYIDNLVHAENEKEINEYFVKALNSLSYIDLYKMKIWKG